MRMDVEESWGNTFNNNDNKIYFKMFSIEYTPLKKNKATDQTKKS